MAADGDQTRRFLGALHGSAPPGSLVEVRFRLGPGMGQRFLRAERLGQVADRIASLAAGTDVTWSSAPLSSGSIATTAPRSLRSPSFDRHRAWLSLPAADQTSTRTGCWISRLGSRRSSASTIVWRSRSARTSTAVMAHGSCDPPARPTASIRRRPRSGYWPATSTRGSRWPTSLPGSHQTRRPPAAAR